MGPVLWELTWWGTSQRGGIIGLGLEENNRVLSGRNALKAQRPKKKKKQKAKSKLDWVWITEK